MNALAMNPLSNLPTSHLAHMLLQVIRQHAGEFDPRLTPADLVTLCREITSGDVAPTCDRTRHEIQRALMLATDQIHGGVYA